MGFFGVNLPSVLNSLGSGNSDGGLCLAKMTPVEVCYGRGVCSRQVELTQSGIQQSVASLLSLPLLLLLAIFFILAVHAIGLAAYNSYGSNFRGFHRVGVDWSRYRNGLFTLVMLTYSTVGEAALKVGARHGGHLEWFCSR